jgi:gas vesicle protein
MRSAQNSPRPSDYPEQHSSFLHGFTLGMIAGAAGYYLFATQKGARMRKQLVSEWEETKEKLYEEGVIESTNVSLREFLYGVVKKFSQTPTQSSAGSAGEPVSQGLIAEKNAAIPGKARTAAASSSKKKDNRKFHGV